MKNAHLHLPAFVFGIIAGLALSGALSSLVHHHKFDRWSIMGRDHQAGPLYQTRTCETCGYMESHQIYKP